MQGLRLFCICLALLTLAGTLDASPLTIASWNIRHLRSADQDGPAPRTDSDYARLRRYAEKLGADVVALQEVEGPAAAQRVFPADSYNFFFTAQQSRMLPGFAVKNHINVIQNPDYEPLSVNDETFSAADITIIIDDRTTLRLLAVHLKTGCWGDALSTDSDACRTLSMQAGALERWIDARAAEGEPFIVLGDFNRRFDIRDDAFWAEISDGIPAGANLLRVTEGKLDRCWGGRYPKFIDHIVLDQSASGWVVAGSFRQLTYTESAKLKNRLSDHCPISIIIDPALSGQHTEKDRILIKLDLIEQQLRELRQMLEQQR
jgi:endonuclease/exonuclease/phosphatase family metal-dependent hydrolase